MSKLVLTTTLNKYTVWWRWCQSSHGQRYYRRYSDHGKHPSGKDREWEKRGLEASYFQHLGFQCLGSLVNVALLPCRVTRTYLVYMS